MKKAKSLVASMYLSAVLFFPSGLTAPVLAKPTETATATVARTEKLPVKEVTIFKDGHALVVREGRLPLNGPGEVILDELPSPLLGTFFPYSLEPGRPLVSVTAGKRKVETSATALTISDLLEANPGAAVSLTQTPGGQSEHSPPAVLQGRLAAVPVPRRSIDELNKLQNDSTAAGATNPQKSSLMEIDTESGATFLPIEKIESLSFKGNHIPEVKSEEVKNVLTLKLSQGRSGGEAATGATAQVGMMYVERGLRWTPSYKVTLNGKGTAKIKLQATLINDLSDLDDVTAQLVVGVPSFVASGEIDAIALSKSLADVSRRMAEGALTRQSFSNAIMTQTQSGAPDAGAEPMQDSVAAVDSGQKSEDLFVFAVKHITLKKGERMVVPVLEAEVPYEDLYTLDVPIVPPPEVQNGSNVYSGAAGTKADKSDDGLHFLHKVRLRNTLPQPFTTAPALLVENSQGKDVILAQSLMTYASPGSAADLTVTTAVDLKVAKNESETGRQDAATTWLNERYARINLRGEITVTNMGTKPAKIEISRKVLGHADSVSEGGSIQMLNAMNEGGSGPLPAWWSYYSWPRWWTQMNGVGKCTFASVLAPGKKTNFSYTWHYFWR